MTTTSGSVSYNVTTSSTNSWLLVNLPSQSGTDSTSLNGISIGTQFGVKIGSQANTLTAGQYTGYATVTDPSGISQGTVTVTLTVNGGNSNGLSITPNPVLTEF